MFRSCEFGGHSSFEIDEVRKFSFAKLLSQPCSMRGCTVLQKAPVSIRKQSLGLSLHNTVEHFSAIIIAVDFNTVFDEFQRKLVIKRSCCKHHDTTRKLFTL